MSATMKSSLIMAGMVAGMLCGTASATGAPAQEATGEVLARELFFEERGPNHRSLWTADPLLARHPAILRDLRREGVSEAGLADSCSPPLPCYRTARQELAYDGTTLLSIFSSVDQFTGGAHGAFGVEDRLYDLRTGRRIRFGDIFTSWPAARPLLQAKVCAALRETRSEHGLAECPDVTEIAFGLSESGEIPVGGLATGFEVRTSDYQLGSYADGRETVWITLDPALLALIKPAYRADFRVPD